jgi:hypothetical protein
MVGCGADFSAQELELMNCTAEWFDALLTHDSSQNPRHDFRFPASQKVVAAERCLQ